MEHDLVAFKWTLLSICYLVTLGAVLAGVGRYNDALGVAAAVTGLIGVIKLPQTRAPVTIDQPDNNPVPVKGAE